MSHDQNDAHRLAALASAPAGDGVEAAAILRRHVVVETTPIDDATVSAILNAMQEYAALARPRAAVGERIEERATEIVEECLMRHGIERSACEGTRTDARAILALQSPPAKVEGA